MDEDLQPSPSNENHIPQPSSAESTDDVIPTFHVLTQVENLSQLTNGENPVEKTQKKTKRAGVSKQTRKRNAPIKTSSRQQKPPKEHEAQPNSKRKRIQKAIHDV